MHLIFSNPAALWCLLGIPAVLLIHLLQRKSRRVTITTLFILEEIAPVSSHGRAIDRIRSSWSLWLQLLAVLLVTWILLDPRWMRKDSSQTIAIVLDSSASMSAFRDKAIKEVRSHAEEWAQAAATTDWVLMESGLQRPTLYAGRDFSLLMRAFERWEPRMPAHDPLPAFQVAENLGARASGRRSPHLLVFVTDHQTTLPANVSLLACGEKVENFGFTGLTTGSNGWRVLVKNFGAEKAERRWMLDGREMGRLELKPGEIFELTGTFQGDRATLKMDADAFALDDTFPIARPRPKLIGIQKESGVFDALFERLIAGVPDRGGEPDISLVTYDPLSPRQFTGAVIVFVKEPGELKRLVPGPVVPETDPLTEGLVWENLLVKDGFSVPTREGDRILVWKGTRPLLFLRGPSQLFVNFDPRQSNALRIPAVVLALNRFIEQIRNAKDIDETQNVETNQQLDGTERAPADPGFFSIGRLHGAAHFADAREADFTGAASVDEVKNVTRQLKDRNSEADFLRPLWIVLLIGVCIASWAASRRGERAKTSSLLKPEPV